MIINKGSDSAIVCFDTKNDKTTIPQTDDYCFSTSLGRNSYFTYQGGSWATVYFNNTGAGFRFMDVISFSKYKDWFINN